MNSDDSSWHRHYVRRTRPQLESELLFVRAHLQGLCYRIVEVIFSVV